MAVKKKKKIKKQKNTESSRITSLLFIIVFFIVVLISTIFTDSMQIYSNRKETEELEQKYNMLLEEEASLRSEVIKLQDPDYVARYAREKFLYSKDGEKILRIVDGKLVEEKRVEKDEKEQEGE